MSVKKLIIVPAVAGILAGGTVTFNNAYAVGQCTAHSGTLTEGSIAKGITQLTGATVGAFVGAGLTAWSSNPLVRILGVGAGSVFGWEASKPIGAAIKNAIDKDEICVGGYCLQCDTDSNKNFLNSHHECENQTVISNGVDTFRCYAGGTQIDKWKKIDLPVCSDSPIKKGYGKKGNYKVMIKDNQTNNGSVVEKMPGILRFSQHACYWVEEIVDTSKLCVDDSGKRTIQPGRINPSINCAGINGTHAPIPNATQCKAVCTPTGKWFYGASECEKGYTLTNPLMLNGNPVGNGIYESCKKGKGGTGGGDGLTCRQKRANGTPTGLACCDTGTEADYVSATDKCVCKDPTKEFKINEAGRGYCVAKGETAPEAKCECTLTATTTAIANARSSCGGKPSEAVATAIAQIELQCKDVAKCDAKKFLEYLDIINGASASCTMPNIPVVNINIAKVKSSVESLDKRFGSLDVSVWKTAEGNFNGARLASDSIAGVVLGTTGALITSSVVKKNQIKSGFEDIVCTVGGQTVGSYGDEITVGIQ